VPRPCLYLVSSSASREYIADCLESLALPRGLIQHFRYLHRYIDDQLWALLPDQPGRTPRELADLPVTVVYVFQEQAAGVWQPSSPYIPLRCGRLVEAFKDGKVAHFYFAVTDYVLQLNEGLEARVIRDEIRFKVNGNADARPSYAHLDRDLNLAAPREYGDSRAFQDFVDCAARATQWRTRSLGSSPLDVTYAVIFFRVAGVFRERGAALEEVEPTLRPRVGFPISEYLLEPQQMYYARIMTHLFFPLPAQFPGQGTARMHLTFDASLFRSDGLTSFPIASSYDLEHLAFQPLATREERRSRLRIRCRHEAPVDRENFLRREVLSTEVLLPVTLRGASGEGRQ